MTNFSPIPFPSNTPLQNLKIVATDKTIYIAPGWTAPNGKTGSAGSWTGQTLGSDTTGDGTIGKPYATLKKAWEDAQQHVITGNATLYIQLQKGIYDLNGGTTHDNFFPNNLVHAQGGNIVIQGDPAAIKERYLWRVSSYNWDLAPMSFYGHTGEVNLWSIENGLTHGFTADDVGGYVAIVNQTLSRNKSKVLNFGSGVSDAKWDGNYSLRHCFNHGYPYEEGDGILGLAKVISATAAGQTLGLAFRNINMDTRLISFVSSTGVENSSGRINGGLRNTSQWCGYNNNYPEAQYAEPIGYYGNAGWSGGVGATAFPSQPAGLTYISDDVITITNFPVVIRSSGGTKSPINVESNGNIGTVGGIRNLLFVNADFDGATYGSQPLVNGIARTTRIAKNNIYQGAGAAIVFDGDNVSVGIRNVATLGYRQGMRVIGGARVYDYSPDYTNTAIGSDFYYSKRTPVFMSSHNDNGIVVRDRSTVKFGLFNTDPNNDIGYCPHVYLQGEQAQILNSGSDVTIEDAYASNAIGAIPVMRLTINIPVFSGNTVGSTSGVYNSWNSNTYRNCTLHAGVGGVTIGRIVYATYGSTFSYWAAGSGSWAGSLSGGGTPVHTQRVDFFGYKINNYTVSNRDMILTNSGGAVTDGFSIRAWSNSNETGFTSGLTLSATNIYLQAQNGATVAAGTLLSTFANSGLSLGISAGSEFSGGFYANNKWADPLVQTQECGTTNLQNLIGECQYIGVYSLNNSQVNFGLNSSFWVKGFNHSGILSEVRGAVHIDSGSVVAFKNPAFMYPFAGVDSGNLYGIGQAFGINSRMLGTVKIGSGVILVNVGMPSGLSFAAFQGNNNGYYGCLRYTGEPTLSINSAYHLSESSSMLAASNRSVIMCDGVNSSFNQVADGGSGGGIYQTTTATPFQSHINLNSGSIIHGVIGVGQPAWVDTNVPHAGTSNTNWSYFADTSNFTSCILYPAPNTPVGTPSAPTQHNLLLTRKSWPSSTTWSDNRTPLYNVTAGDTAHYEWWTPFRSRVGRLGRAAASTSSVLGSFYLRIPIMLNTSSNAYLGSFSNSASTHGLTGALIGTQTAAAGGAGITVFPPMWGHGVGSNSSNSFLVPFGG